MGAPPKGHPPYNVNGEGGRPTYYTDEFIEKLADELDIWIQDESRTWLNQFFHDKKINPDYGSTWDKKNSRFSSSYRNALKIQESRIYVGALKNKFNSKMACFGLMNNHGWTEKAEQKISGDAANPLAILFNQSKELISDEPSSESTACF